MFMVNKDYHNSGSINIETWSLHATWDFRLWRIE